jgi:hypothetical protein
MLARSRHPRRASMANDYLALATRTSSLSSFHISMPRSAGLSSKSSLARAIASPSRSLSMILSVGALSPRVKKHRYAGISYLREWGFKSDISLMEAPLRVTYASFTNFGGEVVISTKFARSSD